MRFLFPTLFWLWLPLVLVPIILYLFRPRPRTIKTSTLPFFKLLAREHQDAAWLKWLKYLLSILLNVAVILAAVAALGRLVIAPQADDVQTVVMVVDRSASMAAVDVQGNSRLASALTDLEDRVDGLPTGVGMVVIAYGPSPEVLLSRSLDKREVTRALNSIAARPVASDSTSALSLARRMALLEPPTEIWHATDAPEVDHESASESAEESSSDSIALDDSTPGTPSEDPIKVLHLAHPGRQLVNVGITAVEPRRLPLERARWETFVAVNAAGEGPVEAELELKLDGKLVELRKLSLQGGEQTSLLIPVTADRDSAHVMSLRLSAEQDALAADNVVFARIPKLDPIRVMWVSAEADPFTELALASLSGDQDIDIFKAEPTAWPPQESHDVVIFDGWLPHEWPRDVAVVAINPPTAVGPIQVAAIEGTGLPVDAVRSTDATHPVLYGVATGRISLTQTSIWGAQGKLDPLWLGAQGPLLLAGQQEGQRIVVMPFSPVRSERLALLPSYPLLVGNAIYWTAEKRLTELRKPVRTTGEVVNVAGASVTWKTAVADQQASETLEIERSSLPLDRVGIWETDAGEHGSAALLSQTETVLPLDEQRLDESSTGATGSIFRGDLAPLLVIGVLTLLLLESVLYHRCVTT